MAPRPDNGAPLLEVRGLSAGYGARQVVFDVDFTVGASRTGGVLGNFAIADVARLRVWDVALTAAQVKAIYTQESALL